MHARYGAPTQLVLALVLGSCGRAGFRPLDATVDRPRDAAPLDDGSADGDGADGSADGDSPDADAGPATAPAVPVPLYPPNGHGTGSLHAAFGAPLSAHPLRPRLHWSPVEGAHRYEVQLDDSCGVGSFGGCEFPSPELDELATEPTHRPTFDLPVRETPPVGRRYFWRVRACTALGVCSAWSGVRYLDAGRQRSDVNGDGYADVVAGAPYQGDFGRPGGAAFVHHGGAAGLEAEPSAVLVDDGAAVSAGIGRAVAFAGDLNADGFADLAVGAPTRLTSTWEPGVLLVYYGSAAGVGDHSSLRIENPDLEGAREFAAVLAPAGDLDADGYADLLVADATDAEDVYVFFGGADGLEPAPLALEVDALRGTNTYARRGLASAGDVNQDGYGDVAVGGPGADRHAVGDGVIGIYLGRADGVATRAATELENPAGAMGDALGARIALAGDVNGDGHADLVAGLPSQDASPACTGRGTALVFLGSLAGLVPAAPSIDPCLAASPPFTFGVAIAGAGDTNGDGYDDVVIGAPGAGGPLPRMNGAYVYFGSAGGLLHAGTPRTLDPPSSLIPYFANAVGGPGDLDGDGFADVIVGAYQAADPEAEEGAIFGYYGALSGPPAVPYTVIDNPEDDAWSEYGTSVD